MIGRRVTCISGQKLGLNFVVFIGVKLVKHNHGSIKVFEDRVANMPEVLQCCGLWRKQNFM